MQIIKKILTYTVLIILIFSANSCRKKKNSKTEIIIDYPIGLIDIMELDNDNVDSLIERITFEFPTMLEGELAKNNTSKSLIKSARLTSMRLEVLDYALYDSAKYSNFKDIKDLYLDIIKPGIGQVNIAIKENMPDVRTKIVNMNMVDVELKQYLQKETFQFVAKYRKRRAMPHQMPYTIVLNFRIVADPL